MSKLDQDLSALKLSPASRLDPRSTRRLIVLIPDAQSDCTSLVHRVWELANSTGYHVQFLGLCREASQEPGLRRQLVTLSAMVRAGNVHAEPRVEIGANWADALKTDLREHDMIVCPAERRMGLWRRPLGQIVESNLSAAVYVLSGTGDHIHPRPDWLSQVLVWTGSIAILAGSALLQIRIAALPGDWVQTVLLILSVVVEVWLIWIWNSLFG